MSAQPRFRQTWISVEDYLAAELLSEIKHEYVDGQVFAMTGASLNHDRIAGNVFGELRNHLRNKPCEPFTSDVKVKVGMHFFYPDTMVVCDNSTKHEYYTETPVLIVEVLSKSTRRRDETLKRRLYQTIPTLQEYVLIEQDIVDVEVCRRNEGWVSNHYFLGDEARFDSVDVNLSVAEIYARVDNEDMRAFIAESQTNQANVDLGRAADTF
ncbi:Uma2 family endonuclease [Methylomonas sp. LL1]|uniref:Uma2 family endonuclease n=1 Tax=Methylomonas sp. LL1 TaxID=2785785 RepID=UPI0018C36EC8|nr:Uma2 family endonuclease [Methylomonas sp. LL1]QPK64908.1 Uma2 family endonuclease [Methylomonas sp. LL1]